MGNMITGIISITIGAVLLANVFMTTIHNTNQSTVCSYPNGTFYTCSWTASEIAMWGLLGLLGAVGLLYGVLAVFGLA